jgi:AcrR family transcriptional regulator
MVTTAELPRRERSKAKRKAAIQRAAMRLFAERGYDATTLAEIAEEADVAPRTLTMYFPTKLELAMSTSTDIAARLNVLFRAHPELSFSAVIALWVDDLAEQTDPQLNELTARMYAANPALRSTPNPRGREAGDIAVPALAAEIGLPADDPLASVVMGAVAGAVDEYVHAAVLGRPTADTRGRFLSYLNAVITSAASL